MRTISLTWAMASSLVKVSLPNCLVVKDSSVHRSEHGGSTFFPSDKVSHHGGNNFFQTSQRKAAAAATPRVSGGLSGGGGSDKKIISAPQQQQVVGQVVLEHKESISENPMFDDKV